MDYLYHYTNVDILALILRNRTIRFNSLDKMDDLQEAQTTHDVNLGKFCFISSWTEDSKEDIPMWRMYTKKDAGVRIKLRKNPFISFPDIENNPQEINIPVVNLLLYGYYSNINNRDILHKVIYTDKTELLYPKVIYEEINKTSLKMGLMGRYKNNYWSFQKEWRYIMTFTSINIMNPDKANANSTSLPFSYYDLTINDEAFSDMEIVFSPNISEGHKTLLISTLEKYNPNASYKDSCLLGLI